MSIRNLLITLVIVASGLRPMVANEVKLQAESEAAIRKAVEAYVIAFNKADAKALAALWAPEAVYTNPISGEEVVGRDAIEKQFVTIFADAKGAKLEVTTESIGFVSPNVAIEQGIAKVLLPDQEPEQSQYSAVYVRLGGQWLLDRVTEEDLPNFVSNYQHLKDLEWMVGSWVDQDDEATVVTEGHWSRNNNFLIRSFAVQIGDQIDMSGMQFIGWDPAEKQIRSWVFDSDGGFGQGIWKQKDNRWYVHQTGVLADGRKTSAINIISKIDDNTCTLQTINRMVDGEILPNIDEVILTKE